MPVLCRYDMSSEQLQWFEGELQRLASRGYRWEHAYTQCVLQAMLYTLRQELLVQHIIIISYFHTKTNFVKIIHYISVYRNVEYCFISNFFFSDPATVNTKICDHFADPKLSSDTNENPEENAEEVSWWIKISNLWVIQ